MGNLSSKWNNLRYLTFFLGRFEDKLLLIVHNSLVEISILYLKSSLDNIDFSEQIVEVKFLRNFVIGCINELNCPVVALLVLCLEELLLTEAVPKT